MSWSLAVKITNGQPYVESSSGIPDGRLIVSGHEDANQQQVSVVRVFETSTAPKVGEG